MSAKVVPTPSLPPGVLSHGDGGFIYKCLTGAAAFFIQRCSAQRGEIRQSGHSSLAELQWALPSLNFLAALFTL